MTDHLHPHLPGIWQVAGWVINSGDHHSIMFPSRTLLLPCPRAQMQSYKTWEEIWTRSIARAASPCSLCAPKLPPERKVREAGCINKQAGTNTERQGHTASHWKSGIAERLVHGSWQHVHSDALQEQQSYQKCEALCCYPRGRMSYCLPLGKQNGLPSWKTQARHEATPSFITAWFTFWFILSLSTGIFYNTNYWDELLRPWTIDEVLRISEVKSVLRFQADLDCQIQLVCKLARIPASPFFCYLIHGNS